MKIRHPRQHVMQEFWAPWFAWYPVSVELADGTYATVWLETIERKEYIDYGGPCWRYRELVNQKGRK